jgi:hypothetical protein
LPYRPVMRRPAEGRWGYPPNLGFAEILTEGYSEEIGEAPHVFDFSVYTATPGLLRTAEKFGQSPEIRIGVSRDEATPHKVRPLAPQQIIEIACADFETPTDKLTAAEQSPPPKTLPGTAQGRFIMVNGRIESQCE